MKLKKKRAARRPSPTTLPVGGCLMLDDVPPQLLAGTINDNASRLALAAASQHDLQAEIANLTQVLMAYNEANEPLIVKPSLDKLALATKRIQLVNAKLLGIEKRLQDVDRILQRRQVQEDFSRGSNQ
ncbi:hypothetical protein BCR37DRAFT_395062 [Protomyces lactucae-debilis]|uniref:Biogenesis of lysosome-related organelles complex 1 subunit 7 n=1 Tax=Protomyces lactucae-debilis TaxID=2754530 RepID=A0A1Y2F0F7_PROLT|nr:uncharacterized protein BCR37DRAFT_395062 [Protomyces lactucae-debilis]ORY76974.1 hypothetical protein BCR37DRAFT_395062 [Protomyces lactucae-debilis]